MTSPLIVEIDRVVLVDIDPRRVGAVHASLEAAVQRALDASEVAPLRALGRVDAPVAREVATAVVRAVNGAGR
jgi:hypothetical protein